MWECGKTLLAVGVETLMQPRGNPEGWQSAVADANVLQQRRVSEPDDEQATLNSQIIETDRWRMFKTRFQILPVCES